MISWTVANSSHNRERSKADRLLLGLAISLDGYSLPSCSVDRKRSFCSALVEGLGVTKKKDRFRYPYCSHRSFSVFHFHVCFAPGRLTGDR